MFKAELNRRMQEMHEHKHKRVVAVDGNEDWEDVVDVVDVVDGGHAILLHINQERLFTGKEEGEDEKVSSQSSSSSPTETRGLAISLGFKLIVVFLFGRVAFELDTMAAPEVAARIIYVLAGFATASMIFAISEE